MKNKVTLTILLLFIIITSKGQIITYPYPNDSSIIRIKAYYRGLGKVFDENFNCDKVVNNCLKGIKLKNDDIVNVEQVLNSKIIQHEKRAQVKKIRKYYFRQYIGYIDGKGDSSVLVILLNFKNRNKALKYFPDWQKNASIGVGGFYGFNQILFKINLSQGTLETY